jgi:hypothetical protein
MNIGKSFSFVFEDPRWVTKVGIGTLVLILSSLLSSILVGILGYFIIAGYGLEVLRNVRKGELYPMPEWRDRWGEWLVLGVKVAVAVLVWSLPAIIIALPMAFGLALLGNNDSMAAVGGLLAAGFGCLMLLWSIVVLLVTPAIYIRLAETEDLSDAFRFGEILSFTREHFGEVVIAVIMVFVANLILATVGSIVGLILCLVGLLITLPAVQFIGTMIQSHLFGQIGAGAKSWQTSIVPEEYIPEPPAAPSVYETPGEIAVEPVNTTPETPS